MQAARWRIHTRPGVRSRTIPCFATAAVNSPATGVAIKVGMFGAITGMQYAILLLTHSRKAGKVFAVIDSVLGIGCGPGAVRNVRMQERT